MGPPYIRQVVHGVRMSTVAPTQVVPCPYKTPHDWQLCPYGHKGETAMRRPPHLYKAIECPGFKRGGCTKGDACPFTHSLFEYCLHPDKFRTSMCDHGDKCYRRICFFAHHPSELRGLSTSGKANSARDAHKDKDKASIVPTVLFCPPIDRSLDACNSSPTSSIIMPRLESVSPPGPTSPVAIITSLIGDLTVVQQAELLMHPTMAPLLRCASVVNNL